MGRGNKRVNVKIFSFSQAVFQVAEIFYIPLRPFDGRVIEAHDRQPGCGDKIQDLPDHTLVYRAVPDDALFADLLTPGLELGLDETDKVRLGAQKRLDRRDHQADR